MAICAIKTDLAFFCVMLLWGEKNCTLNFLNVFFFINILNIFTHNWKQKQKMNEMKSKVLISEIIFSIKCIVLKL